MKRYDMVVALDIEGLENTKWINIGAVHESAKGTLYGYIDKLPAGNAWDGKFNLFEPREKKETAPKSKPQPKAYGEINDDIPF